MPAPTITSYEEVKIAGTVLIVDSADFHGMDLGCSAMINESLTELLGLSKFKTVEATTNPSIIYAAAQKLEYDYVLLRSVNYIKQLESSVPALSRDELLNLGVEHLAVQFGTELYKLFGGISTQVEVVHSFNVQKIVAAGLRLVDLYRAEGVPKQSVRIKISATWEGIQAARILESKHDIRVLITIVFGLSQVIAAAEAGVSCVAPYVGRIGDWYKANESSGQKQGTDKGVERVKEMQNYLRKHGYNTRVMGASFRSPAQVTALAGADYLTVAPAILEALKDQDTSVNPQLTADSGKFNLRERRRMLRTHAAHASTVPKTTYTEDTFRWDFNSDACAVEKSADAMRRFAADSENLKTMLSQRL